ncbi:Subunit of heteropentameric Replication factor C (RF-C) [Friedmanniomyces endolithicus]|uniref:Replication factor C subunit 2 n=2 Tax=Dothideomycetidae TaxID=451867 RepID=A0AAN6KB99_9PEZI|nr:Subunit of heteropentameric Replication factor C (RF-C) [Friedmanniomyces endolithicus]KAK0775181.1 Subunit of heteropentameric Replication factor C (RF-C) [Friedmanniomyces endolithicus]KAK0784155.1 Subunit of heteropentameric Replication factor C (RF-C) [Friedmanniomyces endolithicus]KAK0794936.1 Subunit of heteropentameric Replication factor C (RF-C) [Friedmanniomyces endolithicus]KAK0837394.1 Subunit of heteropentameric Replication factor C (RF-C) [Friedmanniomyces endolithicus]
MASFFDIRARQAAAAATAGSSKQQGSTQDNRLQPWVEKYRPKSLDDITAQDHTVTILRRTLQSANLPHMLFYGPPGTGKTSTVLALAKQLYGPDLYKTRVLELNASDERGISIVREKVKDFARMQLSNPPSGAAGLEYRKKYPCPPYKIIVLDEADSMTQDAQSALRRTMETYSKITRFCLICNYVTRIIDPLASRCSKFRFKSLDEGNAGKRLEDIARLENIKLEDGVVDTLLRCSEGDLRKAITFLQSAARLVGAVQAPPPADAKKRKRGKIEDDEDEDAMDVDHHPTPSTVETSPPVTVRNIQDIAGVIPTSTIDNLVAAMQPTSTSSTSSSKGTTYARVAKAVENLVAEGWSATQIVTQLYEQVVVVDEVAGDWQKSRIVLCFSDVDKRLVDGSDEHLTILDLCLQVAGLLGER